jgi:hypothetical protein
VCNYSVVGKNPAHADARAGSTAAPTKPRDIMDPQDRIALAAALEAALRKALADVPDPSQHLDAAAATLEHILVSDLIGERAIVTELSDRAVIAAVFDDVRLRVQREFGAATDSGTPTF